MNDLNLINNDSLDNQIARQKEILKLLQRKQKLLKQLDDTDEEINAIMALRITPGTEVPADIASTLADQPINLNKAAVKFVQVAFPKGETRKRLGRVLLDVYGENWREKNFDKIKTQIAVVVNALKWYEKLEDRQSAPTDISVLYNTIVVEYDHPLDEIEETLADWNILE